MPERESPNHERQIYEAWARDLFGDFERLHWQAEDLLHRYRAEVLPTEDAETELLFEEIRLAYDLARKRWRTKGGAIPESVRQSLEETFNAYCQDIEAWFRRSLG